MKLFAAAFFVTFGIIGLFAWASATDKRDRVWYAADSIKQIERCHALGGKAVLRPNQFDDWTIKECIQ